MPHGLASYLHQHKLHILFAMSLAGFLLRFYGLEFQSLWNDELATWHDSHFFAAQAIIERMKDNVHPPGWVLFMHYFELLFGDSEFALRLPSAVAGTLAIPSLYVLGKELYSPKEGLASAAFLTVLWAPIYYSQEARAYSMLLLMSIWSTYLLITASKSIEHEDKIPVLTAVAYILTASAACYLHYFGIVLTGLQAIVFLGCFLRTPAKLARGAWMFLSVLLLYLPWMSAVFRDLQKDTFWAPVPKGFTRELWNLLGFYFNRSTATSLAAAVLFYVPVHYLLSLDIKGWRESLSGPWLLLLVWALAPFTIAYIKSLYSAPILVDRYFLISLPAAYLLLARAVMTLGKHSISQAALTVAMVLAFLAGLIFDLGYYSKPTKTQFREAAALIAKNEGQYEGAVVVGCAWSPEYFNYYLERQGSRHRVGAIACDADELDKLKRYITHTNPRYLWYIFAHRKPSKEIVRYWSSNWQTVIVKRYIGSGVLLLARG